jgi:hypothetical protein
VLGGADTSSVLPGDFILPSDLSTQPSFSITFESLGLFSTAESVHSSSFVEPTPLSDADSEAANIQTYSAVMKFTSLAEGEETKEINVSLTHDVYFVTAHPCIPSHHAEILKAPTSPSFRAQSPSSVSSPSSSTSVSPPKFSGKAFFNSCPFSPAIKLDLVNKSETGHPLHKAYTYTKTPLLNLLSLPSTTPFSALLSPPHPSSPTPDSPSYLIDSTTHTTSSTIPKVLVIDCTDSSMLHFPVVAGIGGSETETSSMGSADGVASGSSKFGDGEKHRRKRGSDLEMLARAVCAERGWNALISRRGRGCLACAIREAGSLGWRVVVRVA